MKIIAQLFILVLSSSLCSAQDVATKDYHPIVQRAQETSLYSAKVNWDVVNAKFVELSKGKEDVEGLKEGLQYLINSLGDKHGQFRTLPDHSPVVFYSGPTDPDDRDSDFVNNVINDISQSFSYELLDDGVGYLKVVGIGGGDVQQQANDIRDGLKALKGQGADKWVLDLRYNGGGNMNPMLAGLAPLIGEGWIGGAADAENKISRNYTIENGQFFDSNSMVCEMDNQPELGKDEPVAVLLSRYTISSGEVVAVAFKGRENTRFIGEETAGYTTGNGYEPITDDLVMIISESVFVDRNKIRYDKKVGVDEEIPFEHFPDKSEDQQIKAALKWLE